MAGVKERPRSFSRDMVQAILEERKTQMRLPLEPQPDNPNVFPMQIWGSGVPNSDPEYFCVHAPTNVNGERVDKWIRCPYGKAGDRLWVRETFAPLNTTQPLDRYTLPSYRARVKFAYAADHPADFRPKQPVSGYELKWRPPQSMPRWASRILLEILSIRCERLQDITGEDTCAEGTQFDRASAGIWSLWPVEKRKANAIHQYSRRCQSYGAGEWSANPFVWIVEFKKVQP